MYLSDEEVKKLAQNMLYWLRDGGHLFFRESCYHSSGDMKNSDNPTVYRTPVNYTDLFSAVKQPQSNGDISVFEVITKRAVEAYTKVTKWECCFILLYGRKTSLLFKGALLQGYCYFRSNSVLNSSLSAILL